MLGVSLCLSPYWILTAHAAPPMRAAVPDVLEYPLAAIDEKGHVTGGVLPDLYRELAIELGTTVDYQVLSRKRIEGALLAGQVDIKCYHSPGWVEYKGKMDWTIATLPQIERVVTLFGASTVKKLPDDLVGKRLAVKLGYQYPRLQSLFDSKQAVRVEEVKAANQFRALDEGLVNALILSDAEIEGFLSRNPAGRSRFKALSEPLDVIQTQCMVSPTSPWSVIAINAALRRLMTRGVVEGIVKRYGLAMR